MKKGTTLIENITVILLITILVSILVPSAARVYNIFQRMLTNKKLYSGKEDPENYIKRKSDGIFYFRNKLSN
tara:strand:- start:493 stop:708 length:216 start_codon:yes stop_codon:yes gene_type:complete